VSFRGARVRLLKSIDSDGAGVEAVVLIDLEDPLAITGSASVPCWPQPRQPTDLPLQAVQVVPRLGAGTAVVTGALGFIGSHLAEALLRRGWTVLGIDRHSHPIGGRAGVGGDRLLGEPAFRLVTADLAEADLPRLLDGVSVVFHLAAATGVRSSWGSGFANYAAANVVGTQRLVEACVEVGVPRLVVASSSSVYGPSPGRPSREDESPAPRSPYGVSKLAAEQLAVAYAHRPGFSVEAVVLRYFTVYGPGQRPDMLIARMLRAARTGEPVVVFGDGNQRRSFTFVADAVAATVLAATCRVERSAVFNVAGGRSPSVRDVLDVAARVCGRPVPVVYGGGQAGDVEVTDADLTSAAERLGYRPRVRLPEGLAAQWAWLQAQPDACDADGSVAVPLLGGPAC
jgi:UDP-glucuronate 4-epimerase